MLCDLRRSFVLHQAGDMLGSAGICLRSAMVFIIHGRSCRLTITLGVMLHAFASIFSHIFTANLTTWQHRGMYWNAAYKISANRLKLKPDKTELLWTGTRHSLNRLTGSGPRLVLGTETLDASTSTCLLGVTFTPDLCMEKHASIVSGRCFFQLRQLRRIRRSLDSKAASTLVHSFVSSWVDYCSCLMSEAPKK